MPLVRINDDLHYFAHVPKCGGTSVEAYLIERFGTLGLHDWTYNEVPEHLRWSRTSPQHIPVATLRTLFPESWIASSFSVVRHPVTRLISAFLFARDVQGTINPTATLDDWCKSDLPQLCKDPFFQDGHFLPQSDFVPEGARIFRLEDGLDAVIDHLDALAGNSDGPRQVPTKNLSAWRISDTAHRPVPSDATLARIVDAYACDFDRFGYDRPATAAITAILEPVVVLAPPMPVPRPRRSTLERLRNSIHKRLSR
ncbi:MAG: sulfotransferase family protein [Tabrizicola sp.]|jgi:hypothetical protein|nr:sulfotransferase family protein [Tabrizicola sp.]